MLTNGDEKTNSSTISEHFPSELSSLTVIERELNDQPRIMHNNVCVQTDIEGVMFDDKIINVQRQVTSNDVSIQTEVIPSLFCDEQMNSQKTMKTHDTIFGAQLVTTVFINTDIDSQQQITSQDVDVQTELTSIVHDDQQMNGQQQVVNQDVQTNSLYWDINQGEVADQGQITVPIDDSDDAMFAPLANNPRMIEPLTAGPVFRTMNTTSTIVIELDPIVGYAQEPLLPLVKACGPLNNIIYNLPLYVQKALNETPELLPDELTIDECAAILGSVLGTKWRNNSTRTYSTVISLRQRKWLLH